MFSNKNKENENPFFAGQTDPAKYDLYLDLSKSKDNWRLAFFITAGLLFIVTTAFTIRTFQTRYVPYGVQVDELGRTVDLGPLESLKGNDERLLRSELITWLKDIRSVYRSPALLEENMNQAFSLLSSDVSRQLNQEFSIPEKDPRNIAERGRRIVDVRSLIPMNEDQTRWKIQWVETILSSEGQAKERQAWESFLSLEFNPPTSQQQIPKNPLGIYINELNWGPITPSDNN